MIVTLDEKALENIEAAERLLPDEDGRDALPNAAASRAYYAAYLAIAYRAMCWGYRFTDRSGTYYRHDTLPEDAVAWGVLDPRLAARLRELYHLRLAADYAARGVSLESASEAYDVSRAIVADVLKEH